MIVSDHEMIQQELTELRLRLEAQATEIAHLKKRDGGSARTEVAAKERNAYSRSGFFKLAAASAAGAVALGLSDAPPAAALNGFPITLGSATTNDAASTTGLTVTSGANVGTLFSVNNSTTASAGTTGVVAYGNSSGTGVEGVANGASGFGVLGSTSSGYGVVGQSTSGVDLAANGTGRVFIAPQFLAGPPLIGTFMKGEVVIDQNGAVFVCIAGGSPGTWTQLSTTLQGLQSFPNPRRVLGQAVTYGQVLTGINATVKKSGGPTGVPAGARAAYCAVESDQAGRLTLYPGGTTDTGIANWTNNGLDGLLFLSYMLIPLAANGTFNVHSYITGNIYIDAWGYLL
jgi:hypothetical protein